MREGKDVRYRPEGPGDRDEMLCTGNGGHDRMSETSESRDVVDNKCKRSGAASGNVQRLAAAPPPRCALAFRLLARLFFLRLRAPRGCHGRGQEHAVPLLQFVFLLDPVLPHDDGSDQMVKQILDTCNARARTTTRCGQR